MDLEALHSALSQHNFPMTWPGHWIMGDWHQPRRSGPPKTSYNPSTGQRLMDVWIEREAVTFAVEHGTLAKNSCAKQSLDQRLEILSQLRQTMADHQTILELILGIEAGKPSWEARRDISNALSYLSWTVEHGSQALQSLSAPARLGTHKGDIELLPIGVTAAYLPFSTPLTSFVFYFAASMLAGCPLILCTSSHAVVFGTCLALLCQRARIAPENLSIIFGNFQGFRQLIAERRVAAILYTGSREHCDVIRLESRGHVGRQIVLQSGGKNAVIVGPEADLDLAVKTVSYGALTSAGQRCTSTSRVFVHRDRLSQFNEALVASFKRQPIGRTDHFKSRPASGGPFMGPLYSEKAVQKYLRFQTMANREAEKTLLWGRALEGEGPGFFVTPSVHYLTHFDNSTAYQGNVLFFPDVAIYDFDSLELAIDRINTTDAAFAVSYVGDPARLREKRHLFLAPNLLANLPTVELDATLPLAGRLQSGHHRFHGPGIALYLCYPQVLSQSSEATTLVRSWPWP